MRTGSAGDGLRWRRAKAVESEPLLEAKQEIASLAVLQLGSHYIGLSWATADRPARYWTSPNPLQWKPAQAVKFKASVAAETLSNPFLSEGQWTAMYEQKDRICWNVLQAG